VKRILQIIVAALLLTVLACLYYGFRVEPEQIRLRSVMMDSPHWTSEPLRIGLISDLHIGGPHIDPLQLSKITTLMNAQRPDIILLAGDYVDSHEPSHERSTADNNLINRGHQILGDLNAPLGILAVMGNHDYQYGVHKVRKNIEAAGVNFVDNDAIIIDERFCVFGIADEFFGGPTNDGYYNCPPNVPTIGLMHNPDSFFRVPESSAALMVAGHTHGGQINLPLLGRAITSTKAGKPYAYGVNEVKETPVFITAGIGTSILPARFRAPPEIVLIELRGAE